ncbi:nicotinate (nicotinamide) nucleotide adenylyltransferase [Aliarcobacter lanthieri]|uniref:nicotinate (nicotinamide) nucleotide adenylyltransferase n=1 Tax=Aliarcobacter lanthieri TaxID=1355374 RepID=UPI0019209669|nr:nicotinate (nicotinamide) nucleotide adenylyltransferase [Aliarcobacter lanthieri]MBL3519237.1 nicotinate (nicotinamide) nucleotide adenylyltransferase [Aliarcobacter lanthieri]
MRIAIFGGSFDPVHIAHKTIVEVALKNLDIDKLIVVPTYLNPFKSSFYLEPKIRFELLKKVFADFTNVEICDYEIKRDKVSYTYDTVNYIKSLYKPSKIYFIIGEDNVRNLHKWYKIEELKRELEFVVVTRVGFNQNIEDFKILDINIDISSTNLREQIDLNFVPEVIQEDILNLQKGRKIE